MKTRYKSTSFKTNILFVLNAVIVAVLSIGASYFTLVPLIMFERNISEIVRIVTQNSAMIGLWLIYFASIAFLPMTFKCRYKKQKIAFVVFVVGIVIFVLFITGLVSCWESSILKFFGMDYNERLGCLNEN